MGRGGQLPPGEAEASGKEASALVPVPLVGDRPGAHGRDVERRGDETAAVLVVPVDGVLLVASGHEDRGAVLGRQRDHACARPGKGEPVAQGVDPERSRSGGHARGRKGLAWPGVPRIEEHDGVVGIEDHRLLLRAVAEADGPAAGLPGGRPLLEDRGLREHEQAPVLLELPIEHRRRAGRALRGLAVHAVQAPQRAIRGLLEPAVAHDPGDPWRGPRRQRRMAGAGLGVEVPVARAGLHPRLVEQPLSPATYQGR